MKFTALTRLERNVHRVGEIIGVLAKYGLADWVKGLNYSWIQDRTQSVDGQHIPDLKIEERVRLAFTELGTTFIKLGQVLSTRPDLVGPEMARELAHLQTATPAAPPGTSENRLQHHIAKELGGERLEDLTLAPLQQFLERKAISGLSFSIVDHLRWDLTSMFEMAVSERVISVNPTTALYTPKSAKRSVSQTMSAEDVELPLSVLEYREQVVLQLAVFAGMRPGELLAIQREHVKPDASVIEIRRRVYRGKFAAPKNGLVQTIPDR